NSELDQLIDEGLFSTNSRPDGLRRHILTVDNRVPGEHPKRCGISSHLKVSVGEEVLVVVPGGRTLIEAGQCGHLLLNFFLQLPCEIVSSGPLAAASLSKHQ